VAGVVGVPDLNRGVWQGVAAGVEDLTRDSQRQTGIGWRGKAD
jgi:hypothetical protein